LAAFVPWVLLALLFLIPGAYLEFPSDPWEHLSRINEWSATLTVGAHSAWHKSGYFFAYSVIGRASPDNQLFWLDFYFSGVCLLLCWQYYLLAGAAGLGKRAAFLFVLLQTLLFGNVTFSFYRYYGLASTMFSQICAVALIRVGLDALTKGASVPGNRFSRQFLFPASGLGLVLLVAFNHAQGLGIAALGLVAVAIWRVLVWRPSSGWWLAAATLALGAAAVWWLPRHVAIDREFRPSGILNSWYGFNLLSFDSLPADRMVQITGLFGLANLVAGLYLAIRNQVIGWLTITPFVALLLPFVAIPLAGVLAAGPTNWSGIITFHRMFLAIPQGLALVAVASSLRPFTGPAGSGLRLLLRPLSLVVASLFLFTTIPASGPYYNRFWHSLVKVPDDLAMRAFWNQAGEAPRARQGPGSPVFASTAGLGFVVSAQRPALVTFPDDRTFFNNGCISSGELNYIRDLIAADISARPMVIMMASPRILYTAYSQSAILSRHWLPQEAALAYSGFQQLRRMGSELQLKALFPETGGGEAPIEWDAVPPTRKHPPAGTRH
jgi:hypothetical protein